MDNGKNKRRAKKIIVYGIVQGVGFRPLVYHIAKKHGLTGNVKNVGGFVEIILNATENELEEFIRDMKDNTSGESEIIRIDIEDIAASKTEAIDDFTIIESEGADRISIIPPDLPVCPDCQRELYDESDRRFFNPFISCMSCGPRYTIIEELPYDRDNTTMKDFEMCGECREEYASPESRRFHAQTISCNDCGPYLIYRERTNRESAVWDTLAVHCRASQRGYGQNQESTDREVLVGRCRVGQHGYGQNQESTDRETIVDCYKDGQRRYGQNQEFTNQEALVRAEDELKNGGIIAVKGIGGYHLACSPFNETAVENLRKLKGREEKPFAVMFENIESIMGYCNVAEEEQHLLKSKARPIVLLYQKAAALTFASSVNKGSIYCGAFLPYTPLQMLLTGACGPLIMTSANISDRPIIREDEEILSLQSPYLKGVLYNTRRIIRSVDDSVAKIVNHKPQIIRRSRGYVPYPVFLEHTREDIRIFAAGGDLKAAYCLYQNGAAYVSQHFGDLQEHSVFKEYEASVGDLSKLLKVTSTLAVCDCHPNYFSARYAKMLDIPVLSVQHHHAHVASVMAEHHLKERVIGVAFDGTGYGTDGNIWGGEFLICEGADFVRAAHLKYTPILGGDESMKDAKKTASCFLMASGLPDDIRDERGPILKAAVENKVNTVLSSSMGRLFDAVASILDIGQENQYEGECAANLEREAVWALRRLGKRRADQDSSVTLKNLLLNQCNDEKPAGEVAIGDRESLPRKTEVCDTTKEAGIRFDISGKDGIIMIDPAPVLKEICELRDNTDAGILALAFHYAAADMAAEVCEILRSEQNINIVALCGGVFQNTILLERTTRLLEEKGFSVYTNEAVPPNDGSISLGQTYIGLMKG